MGYVVCGMGWGVWVVDGMECGNAHHRLTCISLQGIEVMDKVKKMDRI